MTISPQESRIGDGKRQEKSEINSEIVQRLEMLGHSDVTGCGVGLSAAALRHGAAPENGNFNVEYLKNGCSYRPRTITNRLGVEKSISYEILIW